MNIFMKKKQHNVLLLPTSLTCYWCSVTKSNGVGQLLNQLSILSQIHETYSFFRAGRRFHFYSRPINNIS